jgi:hypothetical protein
VAWAGTRGIARVELSLDGGRSWREVALRRPIGAPWTEWAYGWQPERHGLQRIVCRATDGRGVGAA